MSAEDALIRPIDAQGNQINNLGTPGAATDATQVSAKLADIQDIGTGSALGTSFQAAPAQHTHAFPGNVDLLTNFRLLLRAYVQQGFQIPLGLENEFVTSLNL